MKVSDMDRVQALAYEYGRAVAARERSARWGGSRFEGHNADCKALWHDLIEAGAYADDEHCVLKDDYRPAYLAGLAR